MEEAILEKLQEIKDLLYKGDDEPCEGAGVVNPRPKPETCQTVKAKKPRRGPVKITDDHAAKLKAGRAVWLDFQKDIEPAFKNFKGKGKVKAKGVMYKKLKELGGLEDDEHYNMACDKLLSDGLILDYAQVLE